MGLKTELERKIGLGRDYDYPPVGFGECYFSDERIRKFA
jgi:hypothetical protein